MFPALPVSLTMTFLCKEGRTQGLKYRVTAQVKRRTFSLAIPEARERHRIHTSVVDVLLLHTVSEFFFIPFVNSHVPSIRLILLF